MSEFIRDAGLVALGWLLSVLSQAFERRRQDYLERRRVFTRLDRILTTIAVEVAVTKELNTTQALAIPPALPEDYDRVADQIGDWEARRGLYEIHSGLITLKRLITLAGEGYATISASDSSGETPGPVLELYDREIGAVKELTWKLIQSLHDARLGPLRRLRKRIEKRARVKELSAGQHEQT